MARGQLYADQPGEHDAQRADYDEALAAFGLQCADAEQDEALPSQPPALCYLWPCNLRTFHIWQRIQTQWLSGPHGRTGLNYAGVLGFLREIVRVRQRDIPALFEQLQAMELAALDEWRIQRESA